MPRNTIFHISKQKVRMAGDFIMEYGRDIEKALYQYHFGKESAANVITTLETYCNEDGGIGRLDLDSLYKGSMPINCAHFFSIVHSLKIKNEFKAANDALYYLQETIKENDSWECTVPDVTSSPRAVWWNWDEHSIKEYKINPTSELIGYFYHFGGGDFRAFSKNMLDDLYENFLAQPIGTLKMHDMISLMQMCRVISDILAERFISLLEPHLKETLITDKSKWNEYVFTPLSIFKSPLDPLYHTFEKEITLNLDYDIMTQDNMGYWLPPWHWWQFNEEFEAQRSLITANHTLNRLIIFKNFNRITASG